MGAYYDVEETQKVLKIYGIGVMSRWEVNNVSLTRSSFG